MARKSLSLPIILTSLCLIFSCKQDEIQTLPDPLEAGWKGQKVCEIIEENETLRVLKCTFPPNVGHEKHYHPIHYGYTLSGARFKIITDDTTRIVTVPTGYSFYNDEITKHQVLNVSDSTGIFLIFEPKQ